MAEKDATVSILLLALEVPRGVECGNDLKFRALMEGGRYKNLKLNKDKAQVRKSEIAFIGHILSPDGLKPDSKKLEAIKDMLHPIDVQSLRRFVGLVSVLPQFLPHLGNQAEVLRKLTDTDAELILDCHPNAYSSRVVTSTERNYAQIEEDLLAI